MARFTRLAAQQGLELGQKEMATCSTRPGNARARRGARPRARRAAPRHAMPDPALSQPRPSASSPVIALRTACQRPPEPRQPWTGHSSPPPPQPISWLASPELSEAPRALGPSTTSPKVPD
jgi:hypothetical protein